VSLLLRGDLLVGLVVDAPVTSWWKFVKRLELLLRGASEAVVKHAISEVEENLAIW
jgi:sRNA-binding regulator protein Hfq